MPETLPSVPRRQRSRVLATLRALIRARITTGLITVLPIVLSAWLLMVVFRWLRDASLWVVSAFLLSHWGRGLLENWGIKSEEELLTRGLSALPVRYRWTISIFSVLLTIFVLYVIGLFSANLIGRRFIEWLDQMVARVPFVKTVYRAVKQMLELFSGQRTQGFQRVALVPFPNQLTRSVAFITNTFRDKITGDELCTAFIATTPNPTTGFVFIVRRADIIEVDWSVEEAVKALISAGILTPVGITMLTETDRRAMPPSATT